MRWEMILIDHWFMSWEVRTGINVVVLQNSMDFLKGEFGSSSKRYAGSTADGNETIGREAERVLDKTGEGNQDQTTISVINTEQNVSYVPVVSVTHI